MTVANPELTLEVVDSLMKRDPRTINTTELDLVFVEKLEFRSALLINIQAQICLRLSHRRHLKYSDILDDQPEMYYPVFFIDVLWNDNYRKYEDVDQIVGPERVVSFNLDAVLGFCSAQFKPFFIWLKQNQENFICLPSSHSHQCVMMKFN